MVEWADLATEMESYVSQTAKSTTAFTNASSYISDKVSMLTSFKDEISGSFPDISSLVNYHITKFPGPLGNFGLNEGLASVQKQLTVLGNNKDIAKSLAEVYRAKANGTSLSNVSTVPTVPTTDLDHPDNKPDFVFHNRSTFIRSRGEGETPYPIGGVICVKGQLYVYVEGTDAAVGKELTNGWAQIEYLITGP